MGMPSSRSSAPHTCALEMESDPSNILGLYTASASLKLPAFSKLCELNCYREALVILQKELAGPWNRNECVAFWKALSAHIAGAKESNILNEFIASYISQYSRYGCSFQQALLCQIASDLISQNGKFPSKQHAITHFRTIAHMFYTSNAIYNYVSAIGILNTIECQSLPKLKLEFLFECLQIRKEPLKREFFCGQKPKDVLTLKETLMKTSSDLDFVENAQWRTLLAFKSGEQPVFDDDFIVFLELLGMEYSITEGVLAVNSYRHVGFTTSVYEIVKRYEKKAERQVVPSTPTIRAKPQTPKIFTEVPKEAPKTPKISSYKNRYQDSLQEFKRTYCRLTRVMSDEHFEERSRRHLEEFTENKNKLDSRKLFLSSRKETIEELLAELHEKVEMESARQQQIREELQAKEKESESRGIWDVETLRKQLRPPTASPGGVYRSPYSSYELRESRTASSSNLSEDRASEWNKPRTTEPLKRHFSTNTSEDRVSGWNAGAKPRGFSDRARVSREKGHGTKTSNERSQSDDPWGTNNNK